MDKNLKRHIHDNKVWEYFYHIFPLPTLPPHIPVHYVDQNNLNLIFEIYMRNTKVVQLAGVPMSVVCFSFSNNFGVSAPKHTILRNQTKHSSCPGLCLNMNALKLLVWKGEENEFCAMAAEVGSWWGEWLWRFGRTSLPEVCWPGCWVGRALCAWHYCRRGVPEPLRLVRAVLCIWHEVLALALSGASLGRDSHSVGKAGRLAGCSLPALQWSKSRYFFSNSY